MRSIEFGVSIVARIDAWLTAVCGIIEKFVEAFDVTHKKACGIWQFVVTDFNEPLIDGDWRPIWQSSNETHQSKVSGVDLHEAHIMWPFQAAEMLLK
jgi:hypothetical protein